MDTAPLTAYFKLFPVDPHEIFDGPCVYDVLGDRHFVQDLDEILKKENMTFEWIPSNDTDQCSEEASRLHEEALCEEVFTEKGCMRFPENATTTAKEFTAIASYFHEFFNLLPDINKDTNRISYKDAKDRIDKLCRMRTDEAFASTCFKVNYIFNHLTVGYGSVIDQDNFHTINFISDRDMSWTEGFAVIATSKYPLKTNWVYTDTAVEFLDSSVRVLSNAAFMIFVIGVCLWAIKDYNRRRDDYEEL